MLDLFLEEEETRECVGGGEEVSREGEGGEGCGSSEVLVPKRFQFLTVPESGLNCLELFYKEHIKLHKSGLQIICQFLGLRDETKAVSD